MIRSLGLPLLLRYCGLPILLTLGLPRTSEAACAISNGITLPEGIAEFKLDGNMDKDFLQGVAQLWQQACQSQYGTQFPSLSKDSSSNIVVSVDFFNRARDDDSGKAGCESTTVHRDSNEVMTGATITIWAQQRGGDACGASTEDLIAHGYGHAFGLNDSVLADGVTMNPDCDGTIMGRPVPGQRMEIGQDSEFCFAIAERWVTESEMDPCNDPNASRCECDPYEDCSPILVDLDGNGFRLSGPQDGVSFDINADGQLQRITWTAPGSMDGFLFWDRNGNGVVDDGSELFGTAMPLLDGSTPRNGYVPLSELDTPVLGGDGSGWIDSGDEVFAELRIWVDSNHNARSEPEELLSLPEVGISRLSYDYRVSRERDRWGNLLFYRSRACLTTGQPFDRWIWSSDVAFVDAEEE